MTAAWRVLGIALTTAALLLLAWVSRAPLRVARSDSAVVRISIGARPERIENCRTQTDEELAKLLPQMRLRVVCEGTTARYRLELRRGGELLLAQQVRGGGFRHDRQLYVFREMRVSPGAGSYAVALTRIDTVTPEARPEAREGEPGREAVERTGGEDIMAGREAREADARRRRREEAVPAALTLAVDATLTSREVLLLTYDPELRALKAVRAKD